MTAAAAFSPAPPAIAMPEPPEPSQPVSAPNGVAVHFGDSAATVVWREVPGARGYAITIRPLGHPGPYGEEQVLGDHYTFPFTVFPGYGKYKDGYTYTVCSITPNGGRKCTSVSDAFYVRSQGRAVSTSNLRAAAHKVSSCLGNGEKAGLVSAAGAGIVAAAVSWIPGIDAVAAADVGVGAAETGAATFVACLSDW